MKRWTQVGVTVLVLTGSVGAAWGWGRTGHRMINRTSPLHLPAAMGGLAAQSTYLGTHASDADNRKGSDPAESPKHFLDIDAYPEFHTGTLSHSLDVLIAKYGLATVTQRGFVTWTIATVTTQLSAAMKAGDWPRAYLLAADLGHYVGDAGQPMHATDNYNGQLTGNNGIHARYESTMFDRYVGQLEPTPGTAVYIADPLEAAFTLIEESNRGVDSVLIADNAAKAIDSRYGDPYYAELWRRTAGLTKRRVQRSSEFLASLMFTAWTDAGKPPVPGTTAVTDDPAAIPRAFGLGQNTPNPFNPATEISFELPQSTAVTLTIYDATGREVARPVNGTLPAGHHHVEFNGAGLPSGLYLYRLRTADGQTESRRMLLLR